MKIVRHLNRADHPWLEARPLSRLMAVLNTDKTRIRLVGGCVRDALLGRPIVDIDLACCLPATETMRCLRDAGIKVIPTGLKHGTVTALIKHQHFEITSLRQDVTSDGRHAEVAFTDDWLVDARRRDFTINALYLDQDGSLYDPCGGLSDLAAGRVRFIGDAQARIVEDALRILRFFRFHAQLGHAALDPVGLQACVTAQTMIRGLSGERLSQELFKILKVNDPLPTLTVMAEVGILEKIIPMGQSDLTRLAAFVSVERRLGRCDALARLACLLPEDNAAARQHLCRHLRLSNRQAAQLDDYRLPPVSLPDRLSEQHLRRLIYTTGRVAVVFALLQRWGVSATEGAAEQALLEYSENCPKSSFPLQGRDFVAAGFAKGPALGTLLAAAEARWVDSDFTLSPAALIAAAKKQHKNGAPEDNR